MLDLVLFIISIVTYCDANTVITCRQRSTPSPFLSPPPPPESSTTTTTTTTPAPIDIIPPIPPKECYFSTRTDIIILNDISCPITTQQCISQQGQISFVLRSIKSEEDDKYDGRPNVRVAYMQFDNININTIIGLTHDIYNHLPVTAMDIDAYSNIISNSAICNNVSQRESNPNLNGAIQAAIHQFEGIADSDNLQRDKKIIIFSNCKANDIEDICSNYEEEIYSGVHGKGVNIIMVNNGDIFNDIDNYLMCLVEYDENRILNNFNIQNIESLKDTVCSSPTPTPTTDPTKDPTQDPTAMNDTNKRQRLLETATKRRRRRRTASSNKAPCITLEITLETENLLPLNTNPDPASNIAIIGTTIANETNGTVTVPESPDLAEDDINDIDPQLIWHINEDCMIYNQMNETYWPRDTWRADNLVLNITENNTGFIITIDFDTEDSMVYVYNIDSLPLYISHQCINDLMMKGAIYKNDVLMNETETIAISAGDTGKKIFHFNSTVSLTANQSYQIRFELINGYPAGCSLQDISFEESNRIRRRLLDDDIIRYTDFEANAEPNSCAFGARLARSDEMKTSVAAMCNEHLGDTLRPQIEEGLFQQHASQNAMKNHLFSTGSLHIFDENGVNLSVIAEFPEEGVKEPCIAVDEDNRIIYAIGGHDGTGKAVDYIQAWKFNDDNLNDGQIYIPISRGWRLDKPRYGSMCFYWKASANTEYLVVMSGMDNNSSEFTQKNDFYKDIRRYSITEGCKDLSRTDFENYNKGCIYPSSDQTKNLNKNLLDAKPLLYDNHILYLFGGKTHVSSKPFVQRFDLNNLATAPTVEVMRLTKQKALPLIDLVEVNFTNDNGAEDIRNCYMIFGGQTYNRSQLIPDGLQFDNLQLFCNKDIATPDVVVDDRRRLKEINTNIPRLTEFDRRMLENDRNGRRLLDDGEETEVFIREYLYGLDGMYYNFTVQFEICYDNNDQLKDAEMYYQNIIDSKPNGDDDWIQYKQNMDEQILNYSLSAYSGWSDGFGDVDVYDLDIVDVNYYYTPSPTKGYGPLSHPERRKARNWWNNYMDRNIESDYIWIDDKFPCHDHENDD